jgi:hypothetical protein
MHRRSFLQEKDWGCAKTAKTAFIRNLNAQPHGHDGVRWLAVQGSPRLLHAKIEYKEVVAVEMTMVVVLVVVMDDRTVLKGRQHEAKRPFVSISDQILRSILKLRELLPIFKLSIWLNNSLTLAEDLSLLRIVIRSWRLSPSLRILSRIWKQPLNIRRHPY